MLLIALAGAGLGACGGSPSSTPPSTTARAEASKNTPSTTPTASAPPATPTPAQNAEREEKHIRLVAFVNCLRRQGYNVPEPDANNHLNPHGLPLKDPKFKAADLACFENPNLPGRTKGGRTKAP